MAAIVALEGVLKNEIGDPIPDGIKFFRVLAEQYRIIISSDMTPDQTEHWLRSNLILGYGEIYDSSLFYEGQDLRLRHLDIAKSKGRVDLFIDPDADYCAAALASGIPTILFASPIFVRTTRKIKQWDDLISEVDRQRDALVNAHLGSNINRYE